MLVSALILFSTQAKAHKHVVRKPANNELANYYASHWWGAESPPGMQRQIVLSPARVLDLPPPAMIASKDGTTQEPDELAMAFRPFWIDGKPKSNQFVIFERRLEFSGEPNNCSVIFSADDDYSLSVNGSEAAAGKGDAQYVNREVSITTLLNPRSSNTVRFDVHNNFGPAFARARIEVEESLPVRNEPTSWQWREAGKTSNWKPAKIVFSPVFNRDKGESIWADTLGNGIQSVEFRRFIKVAGIPSTASISVGADNAWDLYVNGKLVGHQGMTADPVAPRTIDVSPLIKHGSNVITAKVWNYGGFAAFFCVPTIKSSI